jgi:hypothetical protein
MSIKASVLVPMKRQTEFPKGSSVRRCESVDHLYLTSFLVYLNMKFSSVFLLGLAPLTFALPTSLVDAPFEVEDIAKRQCYVTCGSNCYTSAQVTAARNSGYNYVKQGGTAGGGSYPHVYNNYEGFDFLVSGTYYEFPLLKSGVFTGSSKLSR